MYKRQLLSPSLNHKETSPCNPCHYFVAKQLFTTNKKWARIPVLTHLHYINNGANTNDTIVINLINIFIDGPEVSLYGSPTVSPTTAAL